VNKPNSNLWDILEFLKQERKFGAEVIGNFPEDIKEQIQQVEIQEESFSSSQSRNFKASVPCLEIAIHHQINDQDLVKRLYVIINNNLTKNYDFFILVCLFRLITSSISKSGELRTVTSQ
jgi:hypothetical protein